MILQLASHQVHVLLVAHHHDCVQLRQPVLWPLLRVGPVPAWLAADLKGGHADLGARVEEEELNLGASKKPFKSLSASRVARKTIIGARLASFTTWMPLSCMSKSSSCTLRQVPFKLLVRMAQSSGVSSRRRCLSMIKRPSVSAVVRP